MGAILPQNEGIGHSADLLLFEHDIDVATVTSQLLRNVGYSIVVAHSLGAATTIFEAVMPRVVVVDIEFSGAPQGLHFISSLSLLFPGVTFKRVIYSGYCEKYQAMDEWNSLPVDAWIPKGTPERLLNGLRQILLPNMDIVDSLEQIEPLYRGIGTVEDIDYPGPGQAIVLFKSLCGRANVRRVFPIDRLAEAGCNKPGALLEYAIWGIKAVRISRIRNISPTHNEIVRQDWIEISEEELKELDRWKPTPK
jgi:CheY-like chemotaxis protein